MTFKIPNKLSLALIFLFIPAAFIAQLEPAQWGGHVLIALFALGFGIAAFAFRWMGGGDGKFLAATALWFGPTDALSFLVAACIAGGLVALALLSFRHVPLPALLSRHGWIQRLWTAESGVPYALAFCAGALFIYPETGIFQRLISA
jgi:prepilin peptidase CpaA